MYLEFTITFSLGLIQPIICIVDLQISWSNRNTTWFLACRWEE